MRVTTGRRTTIGGALLLALVLFGGSTPAAAQPIAAGADPGHPSTVTAHVSVDPTTWVIGSHGARREVAADASRGPWIKQLQLDPPSFDPGPREIVEFLVIGGGSSDALEVAEHPESGGEPVGAEPDVDRTTWSRAKEAYR
jgi:hypothetical protein